MTIDRLTLGNYQVNCYIVSENGLGVIIDPGYEPETIRSFLEEKGIEPRAILLTHGHFDHVGAVKALAEEENVPVYLHPADRALPRPLTRPMGATQSVEDGATVTAAGLSFSILHTPGHTKGSVCYLLGDIMFAGDTLFAGSCGRTDLPGGSRRELRASLNKLAGLPGDYTVYPGHGDATTLEWEKRNNPYLK